MQSKITKRILAEAGTPRLLSILADDLAPSDLQSLLLMVYRQRVQAIREAGVLGQAERSSLLKPADVDARVFNTFDRIAFAAAAGFDALDLSPVCPLGANHALGGVDQNNVLTTIRNAEVLGDSTPAMAVEAARRRKAAEQRSAHAPVRLCSSHRVVRLQRFDFPGFTPHFRLFGLATAGRDTGSSAFEIQHLREHIGFYLSLFRGLNAEGFSLANPFVEISDLTITEALLAAAGSSRDEVHGEVHAHAPGSSQRFLAERDITLPTDITDPKTDLADVPGKQRLVLLKERVIDPLQAEYPEAQFRFNLARLEGLGYYTGLCLRVSPMAPDGVRYPVADGGFTDWTARLLQDRKERLLTSGIGSEFICRKYTVSASGRK